MYLHCWWGRAAKEISCKEALGGAQKRIKCLWPDDERLGYYVGSRIIFNPIPGWMDDCLAGWVGCLSSQHAVPRRRCFALSRTRIGWPLISMRMRGFSWPSIIMVRWWWVVRVGNLYKRLTEQPVVLFTVRKCLCGHWTPFKFGVEIQSAYSLFLLVFSIEGRIDFFPPPPLNWPALTNH